MSHHLRKENILVGGNLSSDDYSNSISSPLNGEDNYKWEYQGNSLPEQRPCPSPAETPRVDPVNDDKFRDSLPQDNNPLVLKSSLQRIGSAKPRKSRVHFAEGVLSPEGKANTSGDVEEGNFFIVREDKGNAGEFNESESSELREKQIESPNNGSESNNSREDSISPDIIYMDESRNALHLELESPDDMQESSPENERSVSRVGVWSDNNSMKTTSDNNSPVNTRMLAPRDNVKSEVLFYCEEPMELESVLNNGGEEITRSSNVEERYPGNSNNRDNEGYEANDSADYTVNQTELATSTHIKEYEETL